MIWTALNKLAILKSHRRRRRLERWQSHGRRRQDRFSSSIEKYALIVSTLVALVSAAIAGVAAYATYRQTIYAEASLRAEPRNRAFEELVKSLDGYCKQMSTNSFLSLLPPGEGKKYKLTRITFFLDDNDNPDDEGLPAARRQDVQQDLLTKISAFNLWLSDYELETFNNLELERVLLSTISGSLEEIGGPSRKLAAIADATCQIKAVSLVKWNRNPAAYEVPERISVDDFDYEETNPVTLIKSISRLLKKSSHSVPGDRP
ncbi:hypothetical protein JNB88_05900 [Rhizobium cauense]|uniref:hypothetical protein n=1 Tax=Rhizobium cauense TaxID=1166683 RepID=UPI001C6F39BC|nr:hypothetical protein [Rhizobium cauense]MBW9113181.1 hypothetical protein [Rhizobium cauense]